MFNQLCMCLSITIHVIKFYVYFCSNLYHCCKAISSLLYPFEWPHHIVPVLPACLTVHCCSDQPYILGIINNNYNSVLELLTEHEVTYISYSFVYTVDTA